MSKNAITAVLIGMFLIIGIGMGAAFGAVFDDMGLWIPVGTAIGASLGMATYWVQTAESTEDS